MKAEDQIKLIFDQSDAKSEICDIYEKACITHAKDFLNYVFSYHEENHLFTIDQFYEEFEKYNDN